MTILGTRQEESRRALRRWIAVSAAAHALGVALALWAPLPSSRSELPPVVQVDLMARAPSPGPPSAAPPAPAPEAEAEPEPEPAPAPAPEPEPESPQPSETVLPETPRQPPEREPEPEPEPPEEPEEPEEPPEPEPPPEAETPEPERTQARDAPEEPSPQERARAEDRRRREEGYEDVLGRLRSEERESGGGAEEGAPEARERRSGGAGVPVSAEERSWMRRAKQHVARSWVGAASARGSLETQLRVRLGPEGEVLSVEIVEGSGNPFYDDDVERAVRRASPFPAPPEAAEWRFVFRPEDLRR